MDTKEEDQLLLPRAPSPSGRSARLSKRKSPKPSAVKCGCILCGLIVGTVIVLLLVAAAYGGYQVFDSVRHPHRHLYLSDPANEADPGSHAGAGGGVRPFIGRDTEFDVYLSIWARLPDAEDGQLRNIEEEEAERERMGEMTIRTLKTRTNRDEDELLRLPTEACIFAEKVVHQATVGSAWNLYRDIEFDLPLQRL